MLPAGAGQAAAGARRREAPLGKEDKKQTHPQLLVLKIPTGTYRPDPVARDPFSSCAQHAGGAELELPPVSKSGRPSGSTSQNFRSERTMLGPSLGILGEVLWTPEGSPSHLLGALPGFQLGCCGQRIVRCGCLRHSQARMRLLEQGSLHPLSDHPHVKHSSMPLRPR